MAAPQTSTSTPGDWTQNHGSGTPLSVNKPSNVVDGDLMVMLCTSDQNAASTTASFTPPAGWNAYSFGVLRGGGTGAGASMGAFYKIAAAEGSSYSVARTNGSANWGVTITRIFQSGGGTPTVDTVNFATEALSGTNSATLNSITTVLNDTLVLGLASWDEGKTYTAPPSGYTLVSHTANTSNDMAVVQQTATTAGTLVAGGDFTLSSATHCATAVIMITPPIATTSSMTGISSITGINTVTF